MAVYYPHGIIDHATAYTDTFHLNLLFYIYVTLTVIITMV